MIAEFSDIPYLIFQQPVEERIGKEEGEHWCFANDRDRQKTFSTNINVTPELLLQEFGKLYLDLDRTAWHNEVLKGAKQNAKPLAIGLNSAERNANAVEEKS